MSSTTSQTTHAASHVTVHHHGAVGVIELSRPDKFNAMSRAAFEAMRAAIDAFEQPDAGLRVILIRAQGRHFCTGGDLEEARAMLQDSALLDDFLRFANATLQRLEDSPLPVVVACQGLALAGGLEIALCGDVIFAAADARFGDQHAQYGLVPAWGATQRLPRLVGMNRSLDLMYSGRWIDAATAQQWGLASYVVAPEVLQAEALRYCEQLAARSRPAVAAMKRLARLAPQVGLAAGLRQERQTVAEIMRGPDPAEGIAAFEARRAPRFS